MENYMVKDFSEYGKNKNKVVQYFESINDANLKHNKKLLGIIASEMVHDYVWSEDIAKIALNLIYYFNGIKGEYDLNKSIAITGTYGASKSMIMKIFQKYLQRISGGYGHPNIFRIVSIEDVISVMAKENFFESELLFNYKTELDRPIRRPANLLINEFGFKYNGKAYGTEYQELIEMFIMKRYDIYQDYGKLTHVTMNFDTEDLKNVFPEKIIDRFKEMFNLIPLNGISYRK